MQLLFMKEWLPDNIIRAICWTLIHSLWQGLILAALAGLLVLFARKSVAAFRYNMLAVLFFLFMGVVAFTFIYELNGPANSNNIVDLTQAAQPKQTVNQLSLPDNPVTMVNAEAGYITRFTSYFNQHASLFVAIWFLVFLAKAVKLMGGLVYVQRIRHYKTHKPGHYWTSRMQELANALGVKVPVRLLESELVKVPLVAGVLKPIILVPLGLMANMPASQVEAILLHELAHIRRRDFLVNLAQSFAETLFFFNPAVLWLSALLREEREHCCDDMAIEVTQSKTGYINALVSFQEYQLENNTPYAMAFPGKKNQLLNRIKRIIDNSHKTLNMAEKSFLVLCLSLIGILSAVWAQPDEQKKPGKQTTEQEPVQQPVEKAKEFTASQQNETAIIKDESKDEMPAYKQHKPLEPSTPVIKDTMPVLRRGNSVMTGTITHDKDGKQYKITIDKNLATSLMVDGVKVSDEKLIEYKDLISSIFHDIQAQAEESYEARVQEHNANTVKIRQGMPANLGHNEHERLQVMKAAPQVRVGFPVSTHDYLLNKPVSVKPNKTIDSLINDLMETGLITEKESLSFRLNKDEFVVNGKAVSADLRQRFQDKYVKNPVNTYSYLKQGNTTSTHVYVD